jgi:uncharacterized protein (UPF0333 family)
MKINILVKILITLVLLFGSTSLFSQTSDTKEMEKFVEDTKADKKKLILSYLQLTEDQTKMFIPVYNEYQTELQTVNERIANLVLDYSGLINSMTDADAVKMLNEMTAIDNKETEMKGKYSKKLLELLPGIKVTRYFQMENKIRAAIKYELAVQIPLVR